jgi:ankyrin repeat protein
LQRQQDTSKPLPKNDGFIGHAPDKQAELAANKRHELHSPRAFVKPPTLHREFEHNEHMFWPRKSRSDPRLLVLNDASGHQANRLHADQGNPVKNNVKPISYRKQISTEKNTENRESVNAQKNSPQMRSQERSKIVTREDGRRFKNGIELFYETDDDSSQEAAQKQPKQAKTSTTQTEHNKKQKNASDAKSSSVDVLQPTPKTSEEPANSASVEARSEIFWSAIQSGNLNTVNKLLKQDVSLLAYLERQGKPLLFTAVESGHTEIAVALIDQGASLDHLDVSGNSTLMLAIAKGNHRIAERMIQKGARIHQKNDNHMDALSIAAQQKNTKIAALLIDKGASVNTRDLTGSTPLTISATHGDEAMARLLLRRGAFVNAVDDNHDTALIRSVENGHASIAQLLLEHGALVDLANKKNYTALMYAADHGSIKLADLLISNDANINFQDSNGITPLMIASARGKQDLVRSLIKNGADTELRDTHYCTALTHACRSGHLEVVTLLLKLSKSFTKGNLSLIDPKYASVDDLVLQHFTLIAACESNHPEIVDLLISSIKANRPKFVSSARSPLKVFSMPTALKFCIQSGQSRSLSVLIKHGIQLNLMNSEIWEAIERASASGHTETIRMVFENFSASIQSKLSKPMHPDSIELQRRLQQSLVSAVKNGKYDTVVLLVNMGALPRMQSDKKESPLEIAIQKSDARTVASFLYNSSIEPKSNIGINLSHELQVALQCDPHNPMIIDAIIQFEKDSSVKQGIYNSKINFDSMCVKINDLIATSRKEKSDKEALYRATISLLCSEFGFFFHAAEAIASAVATIPLMDLRSKENNSEPTPAQIRAAFIETVATSNKLNAISNWHTLNTETLYENAKQAPQMAKLLTISAAPQAGLLAAAAETESEKQRQTLNEFFESLSTSTSALQISNIMRNTGWHPLIVRLLVHAWESLQQNKSKLELFKAVRAKLEDAEYSENVERLSSDTERHWLMMQMNRLLEIIT